MCLGRIKLFIFGFDYFRRGLEIFEVFSSEELVKENMDRGIGYRVVGYKI